MNPLPLLSRELLVASRRTITQRLKLGFGGGSMLVAVWSLLVTTGTSGGTIFHALAIIAAVMALFASIFVASDTISRERREGTLGFLFLTDLHAWDVVIGKLAAAGLVPMMALLAMFPAFALCQLIGGVPVALFWKVLAALVLTLFYSLSATIFISTWCEDHRKAYIGSTLLLAVANPLWLLASAGALGWVDHLLTLLLYTLASALFLNWSVRRLAQNWREPSQTSREKQQAHRAKLPSALIERFPVAWLMLRRQRIHPKTRWITFTLVVAVALWCGAMPALQVTPSLNLWLLLGVHVTYQFVLIARTAYSFYADRQTGALELLLGSRLENEEIFEGFNRFLFRQSAPFLVLFTVVDLGYCALIWQRAGAPLASLPLAMAGGLWITLFGLGWLGVYRSLMMKHPSLAMLATFARLTLVPLTLSLLFLNVPRTDQVKVAIFYLLSSGFLAAFFSLDAKAALAEHGRTLLLRPYTEPPPHIENEWSFIDWEQEGAIDAMGEPEPAQS